MSTPGGETGIVATTLPVVVYSRQRGGDASEDDWREVDRGPGYIKPEPGHEIGLWIKHIDDKILRKLVEEWKECAVLTYLDISENRNITNEGLAVLGDLANLVTLDLSSCGINHNGLAHLAPLTALKSLNISYSKRITDAGVKHINAIEQLEYLDILGCPKITNAGFKRLQRPGLDIRR